MKDVSVGHSLSLLNAFHMMLAAARGALFPFLTLYFRHLGMSALVVGITMAIQAIVSTLSSAIWLRCSSRNVHRTKGLLCVSLIVMLSMTMILMIVPSGPDAQIDSCPNVAIANQSHTEFNFPNELPVVDVTVEETNTRNVTSIVPVSVNTADNQTADSVLPSLNSGNMRILHKLGFTSKRLSDMTVTQFRSALQSALIHHNEKLEGSRVDTYNEKHNKDLDDSINENPIKSPTDKDSDKKNGNYIEHSGFRVKRGAWSAGSNLLHKLLALQKKVDTTLTMAAVISLLLIGELLSARPERLARALHTSWLAEHSLPASAAPRRRSRLLGQSATPMLAAGLVSLVPCSFDSFAVHFYVFAAAAGVAFMLSFCLPTADDDDDGLTRRRNNTLTRCMLLPDCHAVVLLASSIVTGVVAAALENFLLWHIQDVGGSRLQMAAVVAIAPISELLSVPVVSPLSRLIGHAPLLTAGLILMSARVVLYSVVGSPWWFVAVALLVGPSSAMLRAVPRGHMDMRAGGAAAAVLPTAYHCIGVAIGCFVTGATFVNLGFPIILRAASIMLLIWAVLSGMILRCRGTGALGEDGAEAKRRYAKLLDSEDAEQSDSSLNWEDDWLENALKQDNEHPLKAAHH